MMYTLKVLYYGFGMNLIRYLFFLYNEVLVFFLVYGMTYGIVYGVVYGGMLCHIRICDYRYVISWYCASVCIFSVGNKPEITKRACV